MRISDWSSDVCSSDLQAGGGGGSSDAGRRADRRPARSKNRRDPWCAARRSRTESRARQGGELMMCIVDRPSPNFDQRNCRRPVDMVVLHYTGMPTAAAALERLCDRSEEHTSELQSLMRNSYA